MALTSLRHVVFISGPGTTHVRPGLHFCAKLVTKFTNIFISFYVIGGFATQANEFLSTYPLATRQRIRIAASSGDATLGLSVEDTLGLDHTFGPWIIEQLTKHSTQLHGLVVEAPSYIIEDHFNGGVALVNKREHNLPIVSWWAGNATSFLAFMGRNECEIGKRVHEAIANRRPEDSVEIILAEAASNQLVMTPGLPAHYVHEQYTQDIGGALVQIIELRERWERMLEYVDKIVFVSIYEMETTAVEAHSFALSRPFAAFCPGLTTELPQAGAAIQLNTSDPVLSFMNRAYSDLGSHSVVYIAYGTYWFPPAESAVYLRVLIEELVACGLRVVFSVKSDYARLAGLDDEYREKLTQAGCAIFAEWVKQVDVLEHPALHYFVSHGGWNSTTEAVVRGVPMIFWPIAGDQPMNVLHMTRQHDCGFELLQVRTSAAKSTAYTDRGDIPIIGSVTAVRDEIRKVLTMTKGERGSQQRRNVQALGKTVARAMEAGGSVDAELERFGKSIGLE